MDTAVAEDTGGSLVPIYFSDVFEVDAQVVDDSFGPGRRTTTRRATAL